MGGEPYYYFVPYQKDIGSALQALRRREFEAGRYNPATPFPSRYFPLGPQSPAPGRQHDSIEEALEDSDADGTRSILDIERVADTADFAVAARLPDEVLVSLCGTSRPGRLQVEADMVFLETPTEILFAGYSYD